jgi:hypothetical protein
MSNGPARGKTPGLPTNDGSFKAAPHTESVGVSLKDDLMPSGAPAPLNLAPTGEKDAFGDPLTTGTFHDGRVRYDVTLSRTLLKVSVPEHELDYILQTSDRRSRLVEEDVQDIVMQAQRVISERIGFQKAASEWLSPTDQQQALIDPKTSKITLEDGLTIGPFSSNNTNGDGPLNVRTSPVLPVRMGGENGASFVVTQRRRSGPFNYYRAGSGLPLESWESEGVDRYLALRLGEATEGPNMPRLKDLFLRSEHYIEIENEEQGLA